MVTRGQIRSHRGARYRDFALRKIDGWGGTTGWEADGRLTQRPTRQRSQICAYFEELPTLWAKTSHAGRHAIAEAVFERIDVLGATDYTFSLTAHAKARGWDAAFGAGVVRVKEGQSGRGERI